MFNTNEATAGSLPNRLADILTILSQMRADWMTGGTYEGIFNTLIDSLQRTPTESGDIAFERDLGQVVRKIFEKGQSYMEALGNDLKALAQEIQRRHINRDQGFGEALGGNNNLAGSGPGKVVDPNTRTLMNQEMARQLWDPAGTAAAITVQAVSTSVTASTGADNVGNGTILVNQIRGDGYDNPFPLGSKARLRCIKGSREGGGILRNHEEFLWQDSEGPSKMHPDWGLGTRGIRRGPQDDVTIRVADPTAWGERGNVLCNSCFDKFGSGSTANIPQRWTRQSGTAGTDFGEGTTVYFSELSKSLKIFAGGGTWQLSQAFASNAGTPVEWKASTLYGGVFRFRSDGTVTAGTFVWSLTNSSGTVLTNDKSVNQTGSIALATYALNGVWTDVAFYFQTPKNIGRNDEFRFGIPTTTLTGANVFAMLGITEMVRPYKGCYGLGLIAGSTPFASSFNRRIADVFDLTNTVTFTGGAAHRKKTYHTGANQALLDGDLDDTIWPESSGTPDWLDSEIA